MKFYKVLEEGGACYHGGIAWWPLPKKLPDGSWEPGDWTQPIRGRLVECRNGYHGCTREQLPFWLGPAIFEMEYRGEDEPIIMERKVIGRQARLLRQFEAWNITAARSFALDCAEHVLPALSALLPAEDQPRELIATARRRLAGEASQQEISDAIREARRLADAGAVETWSRGQASTEAVAYAMMTVAHALEAVAARFEDDTYQNIWRTADSLIMAATPALLATTGTPLTAQEIGDAERKWMADRLFQYLDPEAASG